MRFSAQAGALAAAIKAAGRAVEKKPTAPILACVKIAAGTDGVAVTGTDLNLSVTAAAEADVAESGAVVLPAERLKILLSELPDDAEVTVAADGGTALAQCGRSRYKLPTLPVADFPNALTLDDGAIEWTLGTGVLKTVEAAQSCEPGRLHLCGTYCHAVDGELVVVAADGFSLIVVATDITLSAAWTEAGIVVPATTIEQIIKAASGKGETLLRSDGKKVEAIACGTRVSSRLIDATFPKYGKFIPRPSGNFAIVDAYSLAAALRRAEVVAVEHKNPHQGATVGVGWDAAASPDLTVSVARTERGEGEDAVNADVAGAARVLFSATRMLALLDAIDADTVNLDYEPNASAILITVPARPSVTAALAVCRY